MRVQIVDDQTLVFRYMNGDEKAFQMLINRHKSRVYSYVLMMVKNEHLAEDVFQDTFIKVINRLKAGKYHEEGKFLPWVMRIAHNLVIDHFRKKSKMPRADGGEDYDILGNLKFDGTTIEEDIITDQIHADLRKLIDQLPDEQREVVMMRHYANMSFKDIADTTNVSINTALGRMRYALINLRKLMEEKNISLTLS